MILDKLDYGEYDKNIHSMFNGCKFVDDGNIFTNRDCIFIEFLDILLSPGLPFVWQMRKLSKQGKETYPSLKVEELASLSLDGLLEWYVNRKHKNVIYDLYRGELTDHVKEVADTTYENILKQDAYYEGYEELNFTKALRYIRDSKTLVKQIVIYSEHYYKPIETFCKDIMKTKSYQYLYGPFSDIVKANIPENTTYVLSDIEHVKELYDMERLKFSSVVLPVEYQYNRNTPTEFKYDIFDWAEKLPCKINFFPAVGMC